MKNPTQEELYLIDKAMDYASPKQLLMIGLWDMFCPRKRDALISNLKGGKAWPRAYNNAKKTRKK